MPTPMFMPMSTQKQKHVPVQKHVVNLSKEETDEFINCFICTYGSEEKFKQIAISYIDRFIGNEISEDLCDRLLQMSKTNVRFSALLVRINRKIFIMFYIKDYFRLIAVNSAYPYEKYKSFYNSLYWRIYEETAELNGYHIGYSYHHNYDFSNKLIGHINFILYKDDVIYIINNYVPNKTFGTSIENTYHSTFIINKWAACDYKFKTPGLSKKRLKDYFKSICIINELKDSD